LGKIEGKEEKVKEKSKKGRKNLTTGETLEKGG